MKYQFELHQESSIRYILNISKHQNDIPMIFQNALQKGYSKLQPQKGSLQWFSQLSHNDILKVKLLALEVCQLCGAYSNGLLGSFLRHF